MLEACFRILRLDFLCSSLVRPWPMFKINTFKMANYTAWFLSTTVTLQLLSLKVKYHQLLWRILSQSHTQLKSNLIIRKSQDPYDTSTLMSVCVLKESTNHFYRVDRVGNAGFYRSNKSTFSVENPSSWRRFFRLCKEKERAHKFCIKL